MRTQVAHADPWTMEALYALSEDGMRHELIDGGYLAVTGARGARPTELRGPSLEIRPFTGQAGWAAGG